MNEFRIFFENVLKKNLVICVFNTSGKSKSPVHSKSLENCLKQKQFRELNEAEIMRHLILMGSTFIFSTVENMAAIWRRFMAITFKFSLASKKFTQLH